MPSIREPIVYTYNLDTYRVQGISQTILLAEKSIVNVGAVTGGHVTLQVEH